jgi:hypothetical protein
VLERVFPADQLDPELLERPVFARPTDQRPIDDERNVT